MATKAKQKKVVYPKVNGEKFDIIRRKLFDELRENFAWIVNEYLTEHYDRITNKEEKQKMADTVAWNCAYVAVTK